MKTVTAHIRDRLLARAGLLPPDPPAYTPQQMLALWESEWVPEFERLQRNRFVMGALRYGTMAANKAKRTPYDRVSRMRRYIDQYEATGNLEHLVDLGNMAMLEFDQSQHPNKHFAAIDDGEHTQLRR